MSAPFNARRPGGVFTMNAEELQRSIVSLANQIDKEPSQRGKEAALIATLQEAPTEVIAGVILYWSGYGGFIGGPDPHASRREAAQAILNARSLREMLAVTQQLHETTEAYRRESGRQTWVIALLTLMMLVAALAQILIALRVLR